MKGLCVGFTVVICSAVLVAIAGEAMYSASGAPVLPDWEAVVTETRQRLGPVRPMQTCVEYSRETLEVCRKRGLDCFELTFSCTTNGHSVVIGRYSLGGKQWCKILDATNRSKPDEKQFSCDLLKDGTIRPDPIYCNGIADCRCQILSKDAVYRSSDPSSAAAIYRPTLLRTIFGARSRCRASCEEQHSTHEQEAKVIQQNCSNKVPSIRGVDGWGIESWLQTMPRSQICSYSSQYAVEAERFRRSCIHSCESFREAT